MKQKNTSFSTKRWFPLILITVLGITIALMVWVQKPWELIVRDIEDQPVPSAKVTLRSLDENPNHSFSTDGQGIWVGKIHHGKYRISVVSDAGGFEGEIQVGLGTRTVIQVRPPDPSS